MSQSKQSIYQVLHTDPRKNENGNEIVSVQKIAGIRISKPDREYIKFDRFTLSDKWCRSIGPNSEAKNSNFGFWMN